MKKLLLIIFLIGFICSFSQNKVTYNVSYLKKKKENLDKEKNNVKYANMLKKILKNIKDVEAELKFNNSESTYSVTPELNNEFNPRLNFTRISAGHDDVYYSNLKEKSNYTQTEILDDIFIVKTPFLQWELSQESKKIGEYICFKATLKERNKIITAWYCPKLTFNFGPKNYNGLPGLILELEDEKVRFSAKKIELNTKKSNKVMKPKRGKVISKEEFDTLLEKSIPIGFKRPKN